jgi:hypothetical protein
MNKFNGNFNKSTIITNSIGSTIKITNENTSDSDFKKSKKKNKKKKNKKVKEKENSLQNIGRLPEDKQQYVMFTHITEELLYDLTEIVLKVAKTSPEMKRFMEGLPNIRRVVSSVNSFEKVTERKYLYGKEIFENFAEIDFSDLFAEKNNKETISG